MSQRWKSSRITSLIIAFFLGMQGLCLATPLEQLEGSEHEMIYNVVVNPRLKPLEVHLELESWRGDPKSEFVKTIKIYKNKKLLQTIPVAVGKDYIPGNDGIIDFEALDANFDGYLDLRLMDSKGWRNEWSEFWLYNPAKRRFEYNEELSGLCRAGFGEKKKIVTSYNEGLPGHDTFQVYKWAGKHLVLIKEVNNDLEEGTNRSHRVIKVLKKGKMVVVCDRYLTKEELEEEENQEGIELYN